MTPMSSSLQQEVEDLLQFIYLMPVAAARLGEHGEVEMLNPRAVQLLEGLNVDVGRADGLAILDRLSPGASSAWRATVGCIGQVIAPARCTVTGSQGSVKHLLLQVVRPYERCTMVSIEDITIAVEQERELGRQRRQFALALEHIRGFGVVMLDSAGKVNEWNPSIGRLLGLAERTGIGSSLLDWRAADDVEHGQIADFSEIEAAVARDGWYEVHAPWRRCDGRILWGDTVVSPLIETDGTVGGYVAVIRDVTDEHLQSQRLMDAALTDPLTGLFNRRGLQQRLSAKPRTRAALGPRTWVMVDIDHFKKVNDTCGHEGGDVVLKAVAVALQEAARETDTLARLGGEEFVLLIPDSDQGVGVRVAERIRRCVEELAIVTAKRTVQVTASFGVATEEPGEEWKDALERADAALYRAKSEGRNRVILAGPARA